MTIESGEWGACAREGGYTVVAVPTRGGDVKLIRSGFASPDKARMCDTMVRARVAPVVALPSIREMRDEAARHMFGRRGA